MCIDEMTIMSEMTMLSVSDFLRFTSNPPAMSDDYERIMKNMIYPFRLRYACILNGLGCLGSVTCVTLTIKLLK